MGIIELKSDQYFVRIRPQSMLFLVSVWVVSIDER